MKNRNIVHARQEAGILREHYKPSLNLFRVTRSILGVLLFGRSTVTRNHVAKNRMI